MPRDASPSEDLSERRERVTQVIDAVIDRRLAGEDLADEAVIAEHPELMPELGQRLGDIRRIEQAGRCAEQADTAVIPRVGGAHASAAAGEPLPADSFTGYQLVREIHRGGQGVVYQAIQQATKRRVAIKVLREGPFAGSRDRARFEREVQILGQLKHPNIVAIHDSGSAAGHHYFVMDYIAGEALDVYLAGGERSLESTLRLFVKICQAVYVAHLRGVIHRDLKPGNIRIDPSGVPHILDFGLAKVSEFDVWSDERSGEMTQTGQFVGSLPWASPEQAAGRSDQIDVRTDVYALGVILYHMLTRRFPYEVVGNMRDVLDNILRAEPTRPSTLCRQINDEVETIVLKCLSKQRERRYQSAGELARDIERYLAGEPIEAKGDSTFYVLRKQLARHKGPVSIAALFLLLVLGFALVMSFQATRNRRLAESEREAKQAALAARDQAETARNRAVVAEQRATSIKEFLQTMLASVDPEWARGRDVTVLRELLEAAARRAEAELNEQPEVEAAVRTTIGTTYKALGLYAAAEPHLRAALDIRRRVLGREHSDTRQSLMEWAKLVHARGDLNEAERLFREYLELNRRAVGGAPEDTVIAQHKLAQVLHDQGRLDEAERLYHEVLVDARRLYGEAHLQTIAAVNSLATLFYQQAQFDRAEPYLRELLELFRRREGDEHPGTLTIMNNLAALLKAAGKLDEAGELYRQTLEVRRRVLGDEHPHTLISMENYARLLLAQGELDDAQVLLASVLEVQRRVLGDDHPHTIITLYNLSGLLKDRGKFDDAEPLMREVLTRCRAAYGDEHAETVETIDHVGSFYLAQGDLAVAERLLRQAVALAPTAFPTGDARIGRFQANLGACLTRLGRYDEAEAQLQAAHAALRESLGDEHAYTRQTSARLVALYEAWGKPQQAAAYRTTHPPGGE